VTNIGLDWIDLTIPSAPQCLSHTAPGAYLDFLTRGEISVVSGVAVSGEDLNLSAILMYTVSMISSI